MPFLRHVFETLKAAGIALAGSLAALMLAALVAIPSNAFAKPDDTRPTVTVTSDLAYQSVPAEGGKIYLHVELKALRIEREEDNRTPVNIALVVDQSGSMRGARLRSAKRAALEALTRLSRKDSVALVAYNHNVDVLYEADRLQNYSALEDAIDQLQANGRTALYAGVQEGARQLDRYYSDRRVNRVILLSDGMANVGPSKPSDLSKLGQRLAQDGISVSTIGLGLNYNEDLMQQLALASDGNHAFAETPNDLAGIFNSEFGDTLGIAAQDVEVIIETRDGYQPTRILGLPGRIEGQTAKVKLSQLTGGFERYVLIELDAEPGKAGDPESVAKVSVDYMDLTKGARGTESLTVDAARVRTQPEVDASANPEIVAKVTEQRVNLNEEEAVKLRDAGDLAGAKRLLESNVQALSAAASPSLGLKADSEISKRLRKKAQKARETARALDGDAWDKTRKALRYDQLKTKRQQSY